MNLNSRIALITGSSQGIGKDIALALLKAKAKIVITSRREDVLKKIIQDHKYAKEDIYYIAGDATNENDVKNIISKVINHFGKLDILINNVGGAIQFGDIFDLNKEDWINAFDLNVMSMVYFVKHSHRWLKKSQYPRIINISSISGIEPGYYNPHYNITKAASINFTKYIANKFAKDKILANVICPGIIDNEARKNFIKHLAIKNNIDKKIVNKKFDQQDIKKIPLSVLGDGKNIGEMVVFLASDNAAWITGSCLRIDGGKSNSIF